MSKATATIRYNGPALADHQMDIADLAPALMGLSELCKITNKLANGDRASTRVLISTDADHRCFEFRIQVVQSVLEYTKSILGSHDISSAKDILTWLGIGSGSTLTSAWGLVKFLKWLNGRKVTDTKLALSEGSAIYQVTVTGDNNNVAFLPQQTLALMRDPAALANIKRVVDPVAKEGYESLAFEGPNKEKLTITKEDALAIKRIGDVSDIEEPHEDTPQTIEAWVKVYAPVYDATCKKWRFYFGNEHHYMDISETEIASKAIERGGALINDAYFVRLEIIQVHKGGGEIANSYKIKEVLDFRPAQIASQLDLFKPREK